MRLLRIGFGLVLCLMALESVYAQRTFVGVQGETRREYWQLGPFYSQTKSPGQTERILHPLYSHYRDYERAYSHSSVLFPVYTAHGTNHWRRWSVLYLFSGDSVYREKEKEDTDILLAPFIYWGKGDTEEERYLSVFPFYGKIKDKFAQSEMSFVMWPAYVRWKYGNYSATGIFWPLFMYGKSPRRSDIRVWPFYVKKQFRGKYDRRGALCPLIVCFINWGKEGLDKTEPRGYFYFWPFYGRKWSRDGNLNVHAILPILGGWSLLAWGHDKKTESSDFKALFFLFQRTKSKDPYIDKLIVMPFYGYYDFGNFEDESTQGYSATKEGYFITPFFTKLKTHSVILEAEYTSLFPFYINNKRYYRKERESVNYFKFWPLVRYQHDTRGNMSIRALSLLPWRSDMFEKVWGPYYSLFEYNRYENGDRYFSLFFRLYSQYWNAREFHLYLFWLFEMHSTPHYWSFKVLGGLLGYRRDFARAAAEPLLEPVRLGPARISEPPDLDGVRMQPGRNHFYFFWFKI